MFTDTHCHLADTQFDADREAAIGRALQAGVTILVEIAESPDMWEAAVDLAEKKPGVFASLGIHPHHAHQAGPREWPGLSRRLREYLKRPKVVAVGEFGLDYFRMQNSKEQQDYLFSQQLDLAREVGKPAVIHCREAERHASPGSSVPRPQETGGGAHADIQKKLRERYPNAPDTPSAAKPQGTIHCFSGTWQDAQTYMGHGFLLGIDGPVTYPNSKPLQGHVARLPLESLILETDAPYLAPQLFRGQRNEPAYIPIIAEAVGALQHKTTEEVARQTTANAKALFRL